jgi:cystathionine beta-lyase
MTDKLPPGAPAADPLAQCATRLIQHPYEAPTGFGSVMPGVFKASTVFFENTAALRSREWKDKTGYTYGLHGTPTTFILEERLASLEGGLQTLLAPSGLSALTLVAQGLLKAGDEVLIPDNAYAPNRDFTRVELAAWGIAHRVYDQQDPASLASLISERTRLIWLEAPGSVTLEFPDLQALLAVARRHPHAVVALDNTWGAGLAFNPFELGVPAPTDTRGVDLTVHALTKYPSGGADVLMGSVVTRDEALHLKLKLTHMRLGLGVGANDAEALLRGLPSLPLRYAAHDDATRRVAQWWQGRSEVSQVLHPALRGSPGHEAWAKVASRAGGLVSVVFDGERHRSEQVDAFVDALRLFRIGYSWGGPMSLIMPYGLRGMRQHGAFAGLKSGTLVRFAIGLENVDDLLADLDQALGAMRLTG